MATVTGSLTSAGGGTAFRVGKQKRTVTVAVSNTFSGTVKVQVSQDGLSWKDLHTSTTTFTKYYTLENTQVRVTATALASGQADYAITDVAVPAGDSARIVTKEHGQDGLNYRINAQTGTAYTFVADDKTSITRAVHLTNAGAITATVPPDVFAPGDSIRIMNGGAGLVTVDEGAGVTVNFPATGTLELAEQYVVAELYHAGDNVWYLSGSTTPAV